MCTLMLKKSSHTPWYLALVGISWISSIEISSFPFGILITGQLISMTIALIEKFTVEIRSQDLVEIMEEQVPIEFDELSGIFPKLSFYQASLKDQMEELKIINDGVKEYLEELYIEMMNKKLI